MIHCIRRHGSLEGILLDKVYAVVAKARKLTTQFRQGMDGPLAGMRSSKYSLRTSLGRDIGFLGIVTLYVYGQSGVWTQADKSCSARPERYVIAKLLMVKTIKPAASPERIEEAFLAYQSEAGATLLTVAFL